MQNSKLMVRWFDRLTTAQAHHVRLSLSQRQISMLRLNKKSLIAHVSPELKVVEYEMMLETEGLTGGYRPIVDSTIRMDQCLSGRVPNMYFMKYGGIEEMCVGGVIVTPQGLQFDLKIAPRAATGCDLRRVIIGTNDRLGKFAEVALRVFPIPEYSIWGVVAVDFREEALVLIRKMAGQMIAPVYAALLDEEDADKLMTVLGRDKLHKMILAIKLAGLRSMVDAERETMGLIAHESAFGFSWLGQAGKIMDAHLIQPEIFGSLSMSGLFGQCATTTDDAGDFEDYFIRNPV